MRTEYEQKKKRLTILSIIEVFAIGAAILAWKFAFWPVATFAILFTVGYVIVFFPLLYGMYRVKVNDEFDAIMGKKARQREPNACIECARVMPAAKLVHFPKYIGGLLVDVGPLCPDCWATANPRYLSRFKLTLREVGAIVLVNLAVVYAILLSSPPDPTGISSGVPVGLWYVAIMLVVLFLLVIGKTKHDPAVQISLTGKMGVETSPTCTSHPHMEVVGACPYCGAPYCRLCMLFSSLKTAVSPALVEKMKERVDAIVDTTPHLDPKALGEFYVTMLANFVSPETDLNDGSNAGAFEARKRALPAQYAAFYTPAVDFVVDAVLNGRTCELDAHPVTFLACLDHAYARNVLAPRKEKSMLGVLAASLLIVPPVLINILSGIPLEPLFMPMVVCILFAITFILLSRKPFIASFVGSDDEANKNIDGFLVFLDGVLGSRTNG